MPRGFLVKRTQKQKDHSPHVSPSRTDAYENEPSDCGSTSGSELEVPLQLTTKVYHPYDSPDSGYSQSPVNLALKDRHVSESQSPVTGSQSDTRSEDSHSVTSEKSTAEVGGKTLRDSPEVQVPSFFRNVSPRSLAPEVSKSMGMPPNLLPAPLSISTSGFPSPFHFPGFDRLNVTSPKGQLFARNGPFLPHPGLYPGYPPIAFQPHRVVANGQSSPVDVSPNKRKAPEHSESTGSTPKAKAAKKPKAARKIHFEEDKSSPVSGTFIRDSSDVDEEGGIRVVSGDIDSSLNFVDVTPEAREEISKIENKIGDYICQLCKEHYEDAFQLAQHRCSRIVHVEYRCPECDKVFNCPANLASHRRWHKPRPNANASSNNNNNGLNNNNNNKVKGAGPQKLDAKRALDAINGNISSGHIHPALFVDNMARNKFMINRGIENMLHGPRPTPPSEEMTQMDNEGQFECEKCGKKFRRHAYLRKHIATHTESEVSLPCPMCSKVFQSEASRAKHVIQTHNPTMKVPMTATTPQPLSQLSPSLIHGDYTCPLCGNHLGNQLDLERHQRLQHPNEIYACKFCTAVFYSSPGLTRHINKCHPSENRQVILLHMPPMSQINSPC